MNKSSLVAFLLILSSTFAFAQKSINDYKYIIIPKQYEFQKSEDSYQINSLTKFLFERAGFTAYFSTDKFPEELANNGCMALKGIINNESGMFSTKLNIDLVDCYNNTIFSTQQVKSKIKDYKKAYQVTIREAFEDIEALNYSYSGSTSVKETNTSEAIAVDEVEKVEVKENLEKVTKPKIVEEVKAEKTVIVNKEINAKSNLEVETQNSVTAKSIEGTYLFDTWGETRIAKNNNEFTVIGGDENVEFATIYKTSKSNIYIIKWRAFKQPQLVEVTTNGNLNVDTAKGKKVYKRI
ncbi:hypothetical protein MHL31_07000 [Lutibacter sp. A80]|uniref:hypothetical protein n=1 Tax=Lutibacter sp. A80 TaxID=2918453 RepID=UPI001F065A36|nr:hypothetical protein [Lutibacter sp. A80]UMB61934.1 hypothetical protein MHL31_07000 [Lutibacter sp. A80]